ncbi:class I SAM-dependent methyltransferase [Actinoplanes sp. HUAS TT8]|uniref:class I SAM-dependent methyltransferase n=1 Tax=Actinoplanes sp. HUAS TT8 TaxID=3447453 RepID=UPI003F528A1C
MALIAYDESDATAFEANRHLDGDGLGPWREAIGRHLDPRPGMRLLDLGCGTATWTAAFRSWWPGVEVIAVEPSAAMRERAVAGPVLAGDAADIPLADGSVDGVWLSTVIHHVPDLGAAAREIRRVLKPGGAVLIRSAFPGRHEGITLCRFWPETITVLEQSYPSVAVIENAFGVSGSVVEAVTQVSAGSLREAAASLRREAHTLLQLISDEAYADGLARLWDAVSTEEGPQTDTLDLLVMR